MMQKEKEQTNPKISKKTKPEQNQVKQLWVT